MRTVPPLRTPFRSTDAQQVAARRDLRRKLRRLHRLVWQLRHQTRVLRAVLRMERAVQDADRTGLPAATDDRPRRRRAPAPRQAVSVVTVSAPLVAVLDADAVVLTLLTELLTESGLRVRDVCLPALPQARAAVTAVLAVETPQLVLCDVPFPYDAGLAVLAQVQSQLPDVPVIALCTSPEALAGHDGMRAVVGKPFAVTALLALVHETLRLPAADDERQTAVPETQF